MGMVKEKKMNLKQKKFMWLMLFFGCSYTYGYLSSLFRLSALVMAGGIILIFLTLSFYDLKCGKQ